MDDQNFTDVTLATVDDQQIKAHKVILSALSPVFRNILLRNPHQNPLIYLMDVQYYDLKLLLQYIYHGECQVTNEELMNFIKIGEKLQINGLTELSKKPETAPPKQIEKPADNINDPLLVEHSQDLGNVSEDRAVRRQESVNNTQVMDIPPTVNNQDGKFPCDQCDHKATRKGNLKTLSS